MRKIDRVYIHRPLCHPVERQESHSRPCASLRGCPRRIDHILCTRSDGIQTNATTSRRTANEKCVSGKDSLVVAIFEEVADAVLCVARRVKCFHLDTLTNGECLAVRRRLGDFGTIFATDDGDGVCLEHLFIAAGMVMMAVMLS